jgi:hypothetical protein
MWNKILQTPNNFILLFILRISNPAFMKVTNNVVNYYKTEMMISSYLPIVLLCHRISQRQRRHHDV